LIPAHGVGGLHLLTESSIGLMARIVWVGIKPEKQRLWSAFGLSAFGPQMPSAFSPVGIPTVSPFHTPDYSYPRLFVLWVDYSYLGRFVQWTFRATDDSYDRLFVPFVNIPYATWAN